MESCVLIVNRNGQLSACPTREQFERDQFITENMVLFDVAVSPVVVYAMKLAADRVWLAGPGLPTPIEKPDRTYLVVHNGLLFNLKKGV